MYEITNTVQYEFLRFSHFLKTARLAQNWLTQPHFGAMTNLIQNELLVKAEATECNPRVTHITLVVVHLHLVQRYEAFYHQLTYSTETIG